MSYCQEQVIILNKKTITNGDRWYSLLSARLGRINVLVKAAARTSSKLAGHLEIGRKSKVLLVQGSRFQRLAGAQLLSAYQEQDCDWQQLYWRRKGLLLAEQLVLTAEEGKEIFVVLDSYLTLLGDQEKGKNIPIYYCLLQAHLLTWLGWSATTEELAQINDIEWQTLSAPQRVILSKLTNLFFHRQLSWSLKFDWLQ